MSQIRIAHVLQEMDDTDRQGNPNTFSIEFVKSDGAIRRIKRAIKGSAKKDAADGSSSATSYNQKEKGIIRVTDLDAKKSPIKAITIAQIIRYQGRRVFH